MKTSSYRSAEPGKGKPVECATCGRRFVDARSLRQHAAAAHPGAAGETWVSGSTSAELRS